nr:unnamed protein product [Digitaria exilis]
MVRPPRTPAPLTGNSGEWSSPTPQVPNGFEEGDASRGDGLEFANDLSQAALVPSPGTGGDDAAAAAAEDPSKRPDGKKAEKKKLRQRLTIEALDYLVEKMKQTDDVKEIKKEQRCDRLIDLQEEKIKLEREKFEFQRDMEDERILSLDLSNMTYRLQQYYERRQDEILTRRGC